MAKQVEELAKASHPGAHVVGENALPVVFRLHCCEKHHDQRQLGEQRTYFISHVEVQSTTEGKPGQEDKAG